MHTIYEQTDLAEVLLISDGILFTVGGRGGSGPPFLTSGKCRKYLLVCRQQSAK